MGPNNNVNPQDVKNDDGFKPLDFSDDDNSSTGIWPTQDPTLLDTSNVQSQPQVKVDEVQSPPLGSVSNDATVVPNPNLEEKKVDEIQDASLIPNPNLSKPGEEKKVDETQNSSLVPNSNNQNSLPQLPQDLPTPPPPVPQPQPKVEEKKEEVLETKPSPQASSGAYPYTMDYLLDLVIEKDASDLHLTAGYPAMIRIDGELRAVGSEILKSEDATNLINSILKEDKKELLDINREVDLAYAHQHKARFRINAFYQQQTMSAALRKIPDVIKTIEELGLPEIYYQFSQLGQGLVLVTGPTGHGKTTTLAAMLQNVNISRAVHIVTIEDPIEYVYPKGKAMIDQREMHDDTHSWEIALKSAMRQDPDVVLVGEMRDFETISAAVTLAETGHLVFATLHTNNASQTVDRIIDVFPEHQQAQIRAQLSNILEAVIAQRLVPLEGGGRTAVSEIMVATNAVRNLIREGKTHQLDNVIMTGGDLGMISLEASLVKLVRAGKINIQRAQEFAARPEEIARLLK